MKVVSSYAVEIKNFNQIFKDTVRIYQRAFTFLIDIYNKEWDDLLAIAKQKERFKKISKLMEQERAKALFLVPLFIGKAKSHLSYYF